MSKYQEIQILFTSLREAEIAYWDRLATTQKSLRRGFAEFLGVDADKPINDGNSFPVLYFGGKPGSFSGKSGDDTVQEGNELVFTLNVVIDPVERAYPPNALKFRCRTKYVAGRYMFCLEERDNGYTTVAGEDLTPIYEHLYQAMSEMLDAYKRL